MKTHMDLLLVALDLDGTIKPPFGQVDSEVLDLIARLRRRGVLFVLVTGRCLSDVRSLVNPTQFDAMVVENGAIIVIEGVKRVLAPDWWLEKRSTLPPNLMGGCEEVIVSMDASLYQQAQQLASKMGGRLEKNKDRLMLLPPGIDKASGLLCVLEFLRVERERTACIGDGENDLPLFELCGIKVALKNSVQQLKEKANYVSAKEDGKGVVEALTHYFRSY